MDSTNQPAQQAPNTDPLLPTDSPPPTDPGPNEITPWGKFLASSLLIVFTLVPLYILIAYWPDRQPTPKDNLRPLYVCEAFHVRLACIPDTAACCTDTVRSVLTESPTATAATDSSALSDTNAVKTGNGPKKALQSGKLYKMSQLIHLNSLLLLLVAAAGFAGNMIHIATSFTSWIGLNQFRRRWIPWYFIRPFTAAALAIGIYFLFRAGLLNMSSDADNINLYGIIALSILTGLYTDRATKKMAEVVETLFRVKQ